MGKHIEGDKVKRRDLKVSQLFGGQQLGAGDVVAISAVGLVVECGNELDQLGVVEDLLQLRAAPEDDIGIAATQGHRESVGRSQGTASDENIDQNRCCLRSALIVRL